jgi:accessory gene regulator B
MEHYLSTAFAKHLLNKNIIKEEMFEVYVYGAELFLSFVITNAIIIAFGILINQLAATLIHLLIFIALRRFTGGYHATTYLKCKITMVAIYAFTIASAIYVEISIYWYVLLMVAGNVTIFFSAPIENPNKKLDESQKKKCKILSHISFIIVAGSGVILMHYFEMLGKTVFFSLFSVIALMIIAILMKGETQDERQNL